MPSETGRLADLLLDALTLLGLLTIAFVAGPALADSNTRTTYTEDVPLRLAYEEHGLTHFRMSSGAGIGAACDDTWSQDR